MSSETHNSPGFFGKLPALGDFVQRRLTREFVQTWDQWLQGGIAGSKAQLGEHWLNTYLSSPVWRFALSPGVMGAEEGWAGVMIPSVDRVGRYFPLTLASPVSKESVFCELPKAHDWYGRAEEIALSTLEDESGFDVEQFSERLANLGACPVPDNRLLANELGSVSQGWHIDLNQLPEAPDVIQQLGDKLTRERFAHMTLWWTEGSELISPCMLMYAGLPSSDSFTAFLDGRWRESNWLTASEKVDSSPLVEPA